MQITSSIVKIRAKLILMELSKAKEYAKNKMTFYII